ncbi:MAG: helix-turn-helix domain-containing protein [Planctomycetales bacterium]|nr:helix-turn-helix domain-containing protein [Planctomycetales bacterium]
MKTEDAIKYFGSQVALARALGISKQAVGGWGEYVPTGRAFQLQVMTAGKLKAGTQSTAA